MGEPRPQPTDPVEDPAAVVESQGHLSAGVAPSRRDREPVHAVAREQFGPVLESSLVEHAGFTEQHSFALGQGVPIDRIPLPVPSPQFVEESGVEPLVDVGHDSPLISRFHSR